MKITKNMKAGYQGKYDSMRAMAEKLLDHPGEAKAVYYSKSCADKERMRPYKAGGAVKTREPKSHEAKEEKAYRDMEREIKEAKGRRAKEEKAYSLMSREEKNPKVAKSRENKAYEHMEHEMKKHKARKSKEEKDFRNMEHEALEHRIRRTKRDEEDSVRRFAMGGVAKIRHEEATPQGLPKKFKKKSLRDVL